MARDKPVAAAGINLEKGEKLFLLARQHWYVFRNPFLLSFFFPFVLLSAVYFLDYWWGSAFWAEAIIQLLLFLSFFSFASGLLWFFWRLFLWSRTFYLLTNHRLILVTQGGIFNKNRREISLDMIQEVRVEVRGLQAALYRFGDVIVQISAKQAELVLPQVGNPYYVQRLIMRLVHRDREGVNKGEENRD